MPDGFDPHVELERIQNVRDLMIACRQRTPKTLEILDSILLSEETPNWEKIKVIDMMWNRGYGKPRQSVHITDDSQMKTQRLAILPDNGRDDLPPMTIEAETNA
jgi:hypothetical protein